MPSEMVVERGGNEFFVSVPSLKEGSDKHVRWRFHRDNYAPINSDTWRINTVFEAARSGMTMTPGQQICSSGEFELAVFESTYGYSGGRNHGNEVATFTSFQIDGQDHSLAGSTKTAGRVDLICNSDVFRVGTSTVIARCTKRWTMENGMLRLSNRLEWLEAVDIIECQMLMCPILRKDGAGPQITTKASREPTWGNEDVSLPGFTHKLTKAGNVKVWGSTGYSCETRVLSGWTMPGRRTWVKNEVPVNKVYHDYCGPYLTTPGEVFALEGTIRIDTAN
ncbi:MAG: hypothetical protein K5872_22295 [Rhizobiaceae bacterium]|nr:hypothetical protein [Rhizobiaceae bacterium]MCV0408952.1 hypothetical protein [Rhizobiaceae bacterium]